MTKIDILTLKLIVPDDYQQFFEAKMTKFDILSNCFLARFEWFLALFHISDEKVRKYKNFLCYY